MIGISISHLIIRKRFWDVQKHNVEMPIKVIRSECLHYEVADQRDQIVINIWSGSWNNDNYVDNDRRNLIIIVYSGACDWDRPTVCAGGEIKQIENLEE